MENQAVLERESNPGVLYLAFGSAEVEAGFQ